MSECIHHDDPNLRPFEDRPEFTLLENGDPEGSFFILGSTESVNIPKLVEKAVDADSSSRRVLMKVFEQIGLVPATESDDADREELDKLHAKDEGIRDDEKIRTLEERINWRRKAWLTIDDVSKRYREGFWEDKGQGLSLQNDKLVDLYDATDQFSETPLLSTLMKLKSQLPNARTTLGRQHDVTLHVTEAERLARILLLEEKLQQTALD